MQFCRTAIVPSDTMRTVGERGVSDRERETVTLWVANAEDRNKQKQSDPLCFGFNGKGVGRIGRVMRESARGRNRTADTRIFSPMLYH